MPWKVLLNSFHLNGRHTCDTNWWNHFFYGKRIISLTLTKGIGVKQSIIFHINDQFSGYNKQSKLKLIVTFTLYSETKSNRQKKTATYV